MIGPLTKGVRLFGVAGVAAAILMAACGQAAKSTPAAAPPSSSSPAPSPSTTPSPVPSPSPKATGSGNAFSVGSRSITGIGLVLDNSTGFTLYHLTTDSSSMSTCNGGCAQVWPPLLSPNGKLPASPGVNGKFGTIKRPDGTLQVTFNGMPLYIYSGDSGPGQTHGQGIGGVWFAVTAR